MEPIQDDPETIRNVMLFRREATYHEGKMALDRLVAERDRLIQALASVESGIRVNLDRDKLLSIAREALTKKTEEKV